MTKLESWKDRATAAIDELPDQPPMSDEWKTPDDFFRVCNLVLGPFARDLFAAKWNHLLPEYFTKKNSAFKHDWPGRNWGNPRYSRGQLERAMFYSRAQVVSGPALLNCHLVPNYPAEGWWKRNVARPEGQPLGARWLWGRYPEPLNDGRRLFSDRLTIDVYDVAGRIHFLDELGRDVGPARFGSAVVVFSKPGVLT